MASSFAKSIKALRVEQGLSMAELAESTAIRQGSLYTYESGKRRVPEDKAQILKALLCRTDAERKQFDESYQRSEQERPRSPLQVGFDSDLASLRVGSLVYPPFSGRQDLFADKLLQAVFDLAAIRLINEGTQSTSTAGASVFDMKERMRWIEEHHVDILVNLVSLQRLKKLSFLQTPIRVSLNGVILQSDEKSLEAAQQLLVKGKVTQGCEYRVLAVENEVGFAYICQTKKIHREKILLCQTLDAQTLADRLAFPPGRRVMLVSDEVTALGVVAKLRGSGVLVLPPSTDESVIHTPIRRELPAHYLGLAVRRQSNNQLLTYLSEALETFLATEMEIVAEMYEELYRNLVGHAIDSFRQTALYRGGARRIQAMPTLDEKYDTKLYRDRAIDSVNSQNAKAYARRCLSLGRRSLSEASQELSPWHNVLRRTRERVQLSDARNRVAVREVIVSAMKSILGVDPIGSFGESYSDYFIRAIDAEHWQDFRSVLEREFDISLSGVLENPNTSSIKDLEMLVSALRIKLNIAPLPSPPDVSVEPFARLENFVSAIQRLLEDTPDTKNLISIKRLYDESTVSSAELQEVFWNLWEIYQSELAEGDEEAIPPAEDNLNEVGLLASVRILAFSHGEPIGFIVAVSKPFEDEEALEVQHMFVAKPLRQSGVSRRLIRGVIDAAGQDCRFVWLAGTHLSRITEAFIKSGFSRLVLDNDDSDVHPKPLFYQLYGMSRVETGTIRWKDAS